MCSPKHFLFKSSENQRKCMTRSLKIFFQVKLYYTTDQNAGLLALIIIGEIHIEICSESVVPNTVWVNDIYTQYRFKLMNKVSNRVF